MMKFHIENLGKIKQANIEVNDLTIICGPNSSNKTWLSYFINHCLITVNSRLAHLAMNIDNELNKELDTKIYNIVENGSGSIDLNDYLPLFEEAFELSLGVAIEKLPNYFSLNSEAFKNTAFKLDNSLSLTHEKVSISDGRRVKFNKAENSSIAEIEMLAFIPDMKLFNTAFIKRLTQIEIYSLIAKIFLSNSIPKPFVITSERTGCMVFQPEIDRTAIKAQEAFSELEQFSELESLPEEIIVTLQELSLGDHYNYASAVKHNVNIVRDANLLMVNDSFIKESHPEVIQAMNKVNGGTFSYANSQLMFTTEDESNTLPVTISSSSVKSLFLLDMYIKSIASPNDLLLIDEPELNLHPDNQRLMARVIARLVNTGVKVLITTHSDYLIREINNSIMLNNYFEDREYVMESNDIIEEDILSPSRVSAYTVDEKGVVSEMKVGKLGINTQIFDSIINTANQLQSEIYFNLDDVDE